jgi:lipid-A-disaccharide synthase
VITASDIVLLASGTATLEAMLLKRPMVVAYKMGAFSYWLFKRLLKIDRFSLPNLLAGKKVVPELIQDEATPEAMVTAILNQLSNKNGMAETQQLFTQLHESLRCNAAQRAAEVVIKLLQEKGKLKC